MYFISIFLIHVHNFRSFIITFGRERVESTYSKKKKKQQKMDTFLKRVNIENVKPNLINNIAYITYSYFLVNSS